MIFLAPVIIGANAFAFSIKEVCQGQNSSESDFKNTFENYQMREELGEKRAKSLMNWLTTAPPEEITSVWGQPKFYDGKRAWHVRLEPHVRMHSDLLTIDGKLCFNFDYKNVQSFIFVDFENGKTFRSVHNVVRAHP